MRSDGRQLEIAISFRDAKLTVALLGEEKVGLACSREVRDTVTGVEESRALVGGELGVGAESEGFVVAEAAGNQSC